ncbi:MAG: hypothetical protein JXJ20_01980 [Anaerolineae bacterium]|nr:hypothetical protein [Anaerolineae bacterium]
MKMAAALDNSRNMRTILLVIDGLALVGVIVFSVLGALSPDKQGYVIGQIVCAVIILGSVLLLRRMRQDNPPFE